MSGDPRCTHGDYPPASRLGKIDLGGGRGRGGNLMKKGAEHREYVVNPEAVKKGVELHIQA
jgi:hypothetical protein